MIGESTKALVFIRVAILSLRLVTPLSFVYWTILLLSPAVEAGAPTLRIPNILRWSTSNFLVWALRIFTGNEIWFYFWSNAKTDLYQQHGDYEPSLSPEERDKLFNQIMSGIEDARKFISGWFLGAAPEEVYRENLTEWMMWAFFNKHSRDEYSSNESGNVAKTIDRYIQIWETKTGITVPPGYNDNVKCIRLNSDPVNTVHRPACVYIAVGVIYDFLGWIRYYQLGLRHYIPSKTSGHRILYPYIGLPSKPSHSLLTYWYRPCPALKTGEQEDLPIIFIHGIGAGLRIYTDIITRIAKENPRSAIYLLEMPAVTMKFTEKLPRKEEFVGAVESLLHSNGHASGVFMGHSLGTVTASWILHLSPTLCSRVILIDPVCFLLHLPDVAFNFLHRIPKTANQWLYWYFVSNEPGIAWFLGRGFYWIENILWVDQIPKGCEVTVFLSEDDMIVGIPSVWKYLTGEAIPSDSERGTVKSGDKIVRSMEGSASSKTVMWSGPEMDHAMFLLMNGPSADVVQAAHEAVLSARTDKSGITNR